jgi:hypothetical protein
MTSPCLVDVLYLLIFCFYCGVSTSTLQPKGKHLDLMLWPGVLLEGKDGSGSNVVGLHAMYG